MSANNVHLAQKTNGIEEANVFRWVISNKWGSCDHVNTYYGVKLIRWRIMIGPFHCKFIKRKETP